MVPPDVRPRTVSDRPEAWPFIDSYGPSVDPFYPAVAIVGFSVAAAAIVFLYKNVLARSANRSAQTRPGGQSAPQKSQASRAPTPDRTWAAVAVIGSLVGGIATLIGAFTT